MVAEVAIEEAIPMLMVDSMKKNLQRLTFLKVLGGACFEEVAY